MAGSNQTVKVTLVAVSGPLVKGMSEASSATAKLGKDIDGTSAKSKGMESALTGSSAALKGVAVGAAAVAGTALVAFMRDTVRAAGDLEQSVGGVDAVFGSAARQVHDFGTSAADSVGLSRNAFNELATVTGALLKNSGIKDFSSETLKLTQRAADVSATFGGTAKEAVEAFNSALKGEYNPIEKYGVKLNETAINAALAAKGLDRLKGAALEQAKAQERINLIMSQTADHAGRFASEANTLQGQQQRLTAAWEDAKAELGQSLLPVLTAVTGAMREGVSIVVTLAKAWNDLPGPVQAALVAVAGFMALRGPLNGAFGSMATGLQTVREAGSAAVEALGYARQAAERAGGGFKGAAEGVKTFTGGMGSLKLSAVDVAAIIMAEAAAFDYLGKKLAEVQGFKPVGLEAAKSSIIDGGKSAERFSELVGTATGNLSTFDTVANYAVIPTRLFGGAMDASRDSLKSYDAALAEMVSSGNGDMAAKFLKDAGLSAKDAAEKLPQYAEALARVDNDSKLAASGQDALADSTAEAAKKAEDAQKAVDKYVQSLVSAGMAVLSTRDAQRNLLDSLDAVNAQIEKNGTTLDGNTKAGRENQEALDGIARNALNLADAIYKETGSEEQMRASLASSRDSLVQTGIRFGMSQAQAEAYADSILRIPTSKHTNITTNAASAIGDVDLLQQRINSLRGNTIDIGVRYVDLNANPTSKAGGITRAAGGPVWGPGTTTSDSIPAWLSNGEYVVKAAAVAKYGLHFMDRVNSMRLASGGSVGGGRPRSGGDSSPAAAGGIDYDRLAAALERGAAAGTSRGMSALASAASRDIPRGGY